jgi:hypothetical protein
MLSENLSITEFSKSNTAKEKVLIILQKEFT